MRRILGKVSGDRYRKIVKSASLGGKARAAKMSPEARRAQSLKALRVRWTRHRERVAAAKGAGSAGPASPLNRAARYDRQLDQIAPAGSAGSEAGLL